MTNIKNILNIKYNNIKPAPGKVLVSEPFMDDYYFKRSVILLADHSEEGSFGIIVNKPIHIQLTDVITDIRGFNASVYLGGPVKTDSIFFTHTLGHRIEGSIKILEGLYWGGDLGDVKTLINNREIGPAQIRFYLGYSGWSPKQLNNELKRDSWLVTKATADTLMNTDGQELWNRLIVDLGKQYAHWTKFPVDPGMN